MVTMTMNARKAGYIVSEEVYRSRDEGEVDHSAGTDEMESGAVLGKVTASGEWKELDPSASDGTETAAGVLMAGIDAGATEDRTVHVRECEVDGSKLKFNSAVTTAQIATAKEQLTAAGVVVR